MSLTWLQDDQGTFWLLTLNLCGSRHTHLENVSNLSNLRMSLMFEICLTFTERKAKIMLLSPNMRPFCWRHSGSIADRWAGWITISPPLCSRLPARVGTQWVQMSYGPQMVSSSRLYRDNPGLIVHSSRKWFRRVGSRSCFQSRGQSTPINLNWGNLPARAGRPSCELDPLEIFENQDHLEIVEC